MCKYFLGQTNNLDMVVCSINRVWVSCTEFAVVTVTRVQFKRETRGLAFDFCCKVSVGWLKTHVP